MAILTREGDRNLERVSQYWKFLYLHSYGEGDRVFYDSYASCFPELFPKDTKILETRYQTFSDETNRELLKAIVIGETSDSITKKLKLNEGELEQRVELFESMGMVRDKTKASNSS
ncbi:hypothetical protein J4216_05340 [Candidatus Woesearchaeota archaeon]|nr:hypothetical protein [Candidatus Woesearchaeota archaeon]